MNPELRILNLKRIERIFDSGLKAELVFTGGGSGALHALLSTPGASRFVSGAQIPYSPEALERYLGASPTQVVSPETALALVRVAKASCLSDVGVSCTAALATDRVRRGRDRAFIGIKTAESEKLYALYFSKTTRVEQEALLSDWLLVLIAQVVGVERCLMLPGSFNPVHRGHFGMLKVAEDLSGLRGIFELSATNVDKPELPEEEILCRVSFIHDIPIALTRAPRFTQKATLFPRTTFVLGFDTAVRLFDYASCKEWPHFQTLETSFIIAGRVFQGVEPVDAVSSLRFQCLEKLKLPVGFESLFRAISEEQFRDDISSTTLRIQRER